MYLTKVNRHPRRKHNHRHHGFFPSHFDALFDEFFKPGKNSFVHQTPAVNVSETDEQYTLQVAVPGLKKEDIHLKVEEDTLVISAKQEEKTEEVKDHYTRREFNFSNFTRRFQLNDTIDLDNINANFDAGILTVVLPKIAEAEKNNNRVIDIL